MNAVRRGTAIMLSVCAAVTLAAAPAGARTHAPNIKVLSNRANLVSGGDALVRVTLPRGVKARRLKLTAGKRNVTKALARTGKHKLEGVITGLANRRVPLTARIRKGAAARL